jgi:hypothetical protein
MSGDGFLGAAVGSIRGGAVAFGSVLNPSSLSCGISVPKVSSQQSDLRSPREYAASPGRGRLNSLYTPPNDGSDDGSASLPAGSSRAPTAVRNAAESPRATATEWVEAPSVSSLRSRFVPRPEGGIPRPEVGSAAEPSAHEGFVYQRKHIFKLASNLGNAKNMFTLGGDQSCHHLRLKPSGTMIMCVAAGDAEETGKMRLDAQSRVQAIHESGRRPGFKLSVAEYKGKPSSEMIEFQCETLQEVQAWVRAVEGVLSGLRDKRVGIPRDLRAKVSV